MIIMWKLFKLPFVVCRGMAITILASACLYHFAVGHSLRLSGLPDGKTVIVIGRVVEATPASGAGSAGGACVIEDLLGFVLVAWKDGEVPRPGQLMMLSGEKWAVDGRPVVVAGRKLVSY